MKAVTSSIVLVSLVVIGSSLVLPCSGFDSPYLELYRYLIESDSLGELEEGVATITHLITEKTSEFEQRTYDFQKLAEAFRELKGAEEGPRNLCNGWVLKGLRILINEALKYDKTLTGPHKDAEQLNQLLVKLKDSARANCYEYIQTGWNELKEAGNVPETNREFDYINRNFPLDTLLKHFTYLFKHPSEIAQPDKIEFGQIIVETLLTRREPYPDKANFSLEKLTKDGIMLEMQNCLNGPCWDYTTQGFGASIMYSAFELLALEFIDFPGEQKLPDFEPNFQIEYLAAYIICEEIEWWLQPELVEILHMITSKVSKERKRKLKVAL